MNSRVRVMAITAIFAMAFTVVSVKLIWIQLVKQDVYREKAIRMHTNGEPVAAQRGSILDVSGRVLAQSMPLIEVRLDGKVLAERPKELPILAGLLGVSAGGVAQGASGSRKSVSEDCGRLNARDGR